MDYLDLFYKVYNLLSTWPHCLSQTDDRQVYDRRVFPSIFDETAMATYAENTEAYKQLFLDAKKYHTVQAALAGKLYRELHS